MLLEASENQITFNIYVYTILWVFSAKWVVMSTSICKSLGYKAKVLASLTNRYYLDINNKMNQGQLPKICMPFSDQ